jgi:hypothetical protein
MNNKTEPANPNPFAFLKTHVADFAMAPIAAAGILGATYRMADPECARVFDGTRIEQPAGLSDRIAAGIPRPRPMTRPAEPIETYVATIPTTPGLSLKTWPSDG